jgi:hypothetical protein
MMVGTVSYMPPEQATGGEITSRSDLYSLGAMLYEMVTGRPPFLGDDEIAIIGQYINTPPVAPSWHNQSLPQTLDSLIMRLFSGMSVGKPMADYLRVQADLNGVLHDVITVEITETAAMRDDSLAGAMAATLHADGFKLAIDDFGSGATSLAKVRELKFEYLKLDGILVKDLAESESDREFVSALAKLAHDIGVKIIAEFVQDEPTMEFLAECEIEYAQGYYIGEPEPMPG